MSTAGNTTRAGACKPGDTVLWRDERFGVHRAWLVLACCYGAERQESLIRLQPLYETPGVDEHGLRYETVVVPEVLLRGLEIIDGDTTGQLLKPTAQ